MIHAKEGLEDDVVDGEIVAVIGRTLIHQIDARLRTTLRCGPCEVLTVLMPLQIIGEGNSRNKYIYLTVILDVERQFGGIGGALHRCPIGEAILLTGDQSFGGICRPSRLEVLISIAYKAVGATMRRDAVPVITTDLVEPTIGLAVVEGFVHAVALVVGSEAVVRTRSAHIFESTVEDDVLIERRLAFDRHHAGVVCLAYRAWCDGQRGAGAVVGP